MPSPDDSRHELFLRLFTANEAALRGFVRALVPTRADANDVMQETAIVLWRKFGEFATGDDFRRWAFGVARMKVLSWQRDAARDRHVFGEDTTALLAGEAETRANDMEAQREALHTCIEKLPNDQRRLVDAAYAPGVRIEQLALRTGQTAMALYKKLHRIRMTLVECTRRVLTSEGAQ